jgi:hypothetical protein
VSKRKEGKAQMGKKVFFIDHAVERLLERNISVDEAKAVLFDGEFAISDVQKRGEPFRQARTKRIKGRLLKVIFVKEHSRFDIYTVLKVRE